MKHLQLYGAALLGTMKRDAAIFVSYRMRVPSQIASALLSLTTFFYLSKLVKPGVIGPRGEYFAFVLVGIVTTLVLTSALGTAQNIRIELMAGNFERIVISPLGPVWGIICVIAFPIAYATGLAGFMLVLAVLLYGVPLHAANILPALGVGVLGALSLACIGLLFVSALVAFKSALGSTWVIAGVSLFGGAYFPLRLLPSWIRWISDVQPFTPTVDLLRHLLIGIRPMNPVWLEVLKLVGFTAVLMPISAIILWRSVQLSRRRGTMLEF